jgi:hypothetical protein
MYEFNTSLIPFRIGIMEYKYIESLCLQILLICNSPNSLAGIS